MEKAKIKYAWRNGKRKDGSDWKGLHIIAVSEEDGREYSGTVFSKDIDESQYQDA